MSFVKKITPVRGMKDIHGDDYRRYRLFIDTALNVCERYGFRVIKTPIVEYADVFMRSVGETSDIVSKEIYVFDDKGGDRVCLRPEGTAAVMRAIASEGLTQSLPLKFMYYGEMFRYDRPQKGRYRQFHQFGVEHIENKSPYNDAIIIVMAMDVLRELGVDNVGLAINSIGGIESRAKYIDVITKIFQSNYDQLSDESKIRLVKNPLRILDSKDKVDREICDSLPSIIEYLSVNERVYFDVVCKCLESNDISYEIDKFLVRGLDYYTDTTFEIKIDGLAVCGGGRYDKLLSCFANTDVSGVGCAFGVERVCEYVKLPDITCTSIAVVPVSDDDLEYAYNVFCKLRDIKKEFIHSGNLKKKLQRANKIGCPKVIIIGEEERKSNNVRVKLMDSGDESVVDLNSLLGVL